LVVGKIQPMLLNNAIVAHDGGGRSISRLSERANSKKRWGHRILVPVEYRTRRALDEVHRRCNADTKVELGLIGADSRGSQVNLDGSAILPQTPWCCAAGGGCNGPLRKRKKKRTGTRRSARRRSFRQAVPREGEKTRGEMSVVRYRSTTV